MGEMPPWRSPTDRPRGEDYLGELTHEESRAVAEAYLDAMIRHWRRKRDDPASSNAEARKAGHYVDAFQSARASLLGELLP